MMTRAEALDFAIKELLLKTTRDDDYEQANEVLDVLLGMWSAEVSPSLLALDVEQPDAVVISRGVERPDLGLADLLKQVLADEDAHGHVVH